MIKTQNHSKACSFQTNISTDLAKNFNDNSIHLFFHVKVSVNCFGTVQQSVPIITQTCINNLKEQNTLSQLDFLKSQSQNNKINSIAIMPDYWMSTAA
jgi:hypothetical protein